MKTFKTLKMTPYIENGTLHFHVSDVREHKSLADIPGLTQSLMDMDFERLRIQQSGGIRPHVAAPIIQRFGQAPRVGDD